MKFVRNINTICPTTGVVLHIVPVYKRIHRHPVR